MKAIVCEMCGSQDLVKQNGMYVCQNCGTKYDPEEAKKLMVEVSGAVKVDNSAKLQNYYQLARRAVSEGNWEEVERYYTLIKEEIPTDWEAHFYSLVGKAMQCRLGEIYDTASSLTNAYDSILRNIKENVESTSRQEVCTQILTAIDNLATSYHESGKNVWQRQPSWENNNEGGNIYCNSIKAAGILLGELGDSFDNVLGSEMQALSVTAWKKGINFLGDYYNALVVKNMPEDITNGMKMLADRIQRYEPNYRLPSYDSFNNGVKAGCYVATAVYGSYDCPQVWTLRRYRDNTLAETWYGRAFIHTYYAISPMLVKWFGETEWFKNMWKPKLDRMVKRLNEEGIADTPYRDRNW